MNPLPLGASLQYLVGFSNSALDDPASITSIASPAGTLGGANVWTDITPFVSGHQIRRGRQHELDQFQGGTLQLVLNNQDGRFNPWNTSGPYYGYLKIRKLVQVRETWGGTTYKRFTGHVDSWPTIWADPISSFAQLHATDAMRVFQLADLTTTGYQDTVIADGADAFWELGDPAGSTTVADATGNGHAATVGYPGFGATVTFGAAGALPASPATSAEFTTSGGSGSVTSTAITLPDDFVSSSAPGVSLELWFKSSATGDASGDIDVYYQIGSTQTAIGMVAGGSLGGVHLYFSGVSVGAYSTSVFDGSWHHLVGTVTSSGSAVLYVDGVSVDTGSATPSTYDFRPGWIRSTDVSSTGAFFQCVAVYPSVLTGTQVANHYALAAFPQQSTGARVGAALNALGWPSGARDIATGVSTVQEVTTPLTTTTTLSHLQACQATEFGALFMTGDGKVKFIDRASLVTAGSVFQTPQAVFGDDYTSGDLPFDPGPQLALDDIDLYNEARGQRTGGNTQIADDQTSIDAYGRSTWQPSGQLLGISDQEVLGMMQWVVAGQSEPVNRPSSVTIDLYNLVEPDLVGTLLALDLLYMVTVRRLGVPGSEYTVNGQIETIAETYDVAGGTWKVQFGLDVVNTTTGWTLGVSKLGVDTRLHF